jgi:hypothetical protein
MSTRADRAAGGLLAFVYDHAGHPCMASKKGQQNSAAAVKLRPALADAMERPPWF